MRKKSTIGIHDCIQAYLFSIRAEGKAPKTVRYYSSLLLPLPEFADSHAWPFDVAALEARHIREYLDWAGNGRNGNGVKSPSQKPSQTMWHYFRALRRLFNWAITEKFIETSPMANIHFKQPPAPRIEGFSREDLMKMLAVCDVDIKTGAYFTGIRNKAMLLLFVDSAVRRSEMANLRLSDLDLEGKRIRVLGKGNKQGMAPFSPRTAKAIYMWLIERKKRAKCDQIWLTEEGTRFSIDGVVSWFTRLKRRAGITSPGGVHRLRHTAALAYLRGAKDSFLLQMYLRHSSLEMSRRYTQGLRAEEAITAHHNGASPVEGLGLG